MFDPAFLARLIATTLDGAPWPHPTRAVPLLVGTAAAESGLRHTRQVGGGPGRGIFQLEPATERSLWADLLAYQPAMRACVIERSGVTKPNTYALEHNPVYGILLARCRYYWAPGPLPAPGDVEAQAAYWLRGYNAGGKGTVAHYQAQWAALVAPRWEG